MPRLTICALFLLTACSGGSSKIDSESDLARYPRSVFEEQGLHSRYSNATSLDYTTKHGTQVEYTSIDGRAFLWYPGNSRLVIGRWRTETDKHGSGRICFKYPSSSYNPVTQTYGGSWSCVRAADYIWGEEEYARGDPLNLSSGNMPFVMPSEEKLTFSKIGKMADVSIVPSL